MKTLRLGKHPLLTERDKAVLEDAGATLAIIKRVLDAELERVENQIDSDTMFELPAYKERITDLVAQRKTLKRICKYFTEVDHA